MAEQYSNLNVHGKITQKADQADTSVEANQHDVVIVNTLNERVPSAIPEAVAAGEGMALIVENTGTEQDPNYEYVFGEAGKVDDVKIDGGSTLVNNKIATIPIATSSAKGVVQTGTGITNSSGTISVAYGSTAGTACEGNDSRLSDARTPLAHTHGSINNDGTITANKGSIVTTNASTGAIGASGYTIETAKANVTTSATTTVPTSAAVAGAINDAIANIPDPMVFKGTVGSGGTIEWSALPAPSTGTGPTAGNEGWTYKVITKHTTTPVCEVGDTIISDGTQWVVIPSGDVPSGTVTNVAAGVGLTTASGSAITDTGTIKLKLDSESSVGTIGSNKVYAVGVDSAGKVAVAVPWTDQSVDSASHHYTPATASGQDKTASASGATAAWSIDVVQGVTLNTDGKGHVTGLSVTSGKIPAQPSHQTIKQDGITGATVNRYAVCSTAASTAAKTASITTGTFSLETGTKVTVKFENMNSADNPTLNINGTGAKTIYEHGGPISTNSEGKTCLRGICDFVYDGTYWVLVGSYVNSDIAVMQYENTVDDVEYPILLSSVHSIGNVQGGAYKNIDITADPLEKTITAGAVSSGVISGGFKGLLKGQTITYNVTSPSTNDNALLAYFSGTSAHYNDPGYIRFKLSVSSASYKTEAEYACVWGGDRWVIEQLYSNHVNNDIGEVMILGSTSTRTEIALHNKTSTDKTVTITVMESTPDITWCTDWSSTPSSNSINGSAELMYSLYADGGYVGNAECAYQVLPIATGSDTAYYPMMSEYTNQSSQPYVDANIYFDTTDNSVHADKFVGALTGNVTGNCSGSAGSVAYSGITNNPFAATDVTLADM